MKKHIIIAGVPRSGKSTISQKIASHLGYQHISMDSIIAGIERVFPETGVDYYFGTSEVTPEERYELLKKYDTPKDYTYYKSEEENKENCAGIVTISKKLKEQCSIYNLPYYDTSYNREQIFKSVLGFLSRQALMVVRNHVS
ncbi:shikimate kinase [Lachnospiraceae bacterium]|nr:shikimate kinase [Lachnospiraceae bacterium]